jgi:hypothetical protein
VSTSRDDAEPSPRCTDPEEQPRRIPPASCAETFALGNPFIYSLRTKLTGEFLFARITRSTALAVTTWSGVLDSLNDVARASGDMSAAADIAQLIRPGPASYPAA